MPGITGLIPIKTAVTAYPEALKNLIAPLLHESDYRIHYFENIAPCEAAIIDPNIDDYLCGIYTDSKSAVCVGFYGEFYDSEFHLAHNGTQTAEVLLGEYLRYGDRLPERLDGSYIVLISDPRDEKLLIFNDYCASRPLFYAVHNGVLYFSPEAKGVANAPGFDRSVDVDAQIAMLVCSSLISDHTFYKNVKPLFPGKVLTVQGGKLQQSDSRRYLPCGEANDRGEKHYLDALCDLLLQATAKLLRDPDRIIVPLSGGIDSRMIAGCVHKLTGGNLRTVSWGVDDERPGSDAVTARLVAAHLGSDHHFARRETENLEHDLPEMLYRVDGLITDPASHSNELNIMRRIRGEFGGRYILRGEECFGHARTPGCDAEALGQWGIARLSDFPVLERILAKEKLPELRRKSDEIFESLIEGCLCESMTDRREYYYFNVRNFHYHTRSAYCKRTVVDVRNPWMDRDVLEFLNTLPARYRTDRYLYRKATRHMFPGLFEIPIATRGSLENWPALLRQDERLQGFLRANLMEERNGLHAMANAEAIGRLFTECVEHGRVRLSFKQRMVRAGKEYARSHVPGLYGILKPGLMTKVKTKEIAGSEILMRLLCLKVWNDEFVDGSVLPNVYTRVHETSFIQQ